MRLTSTAAIPGSALRLSHERTPDEEFWSLWDGFPGHGYRLDEEYATREEAISAALAPPVIPQ